jgi:hypothetical protein
MCWWIRIRDWQKIDADQRSRQLPPVTWLLMTLAQVFRAQTEIKTSAKSNMREDELFSDVKLWLQQPVILSCLLTKKSND